MQNSNNENIPKSAINLLEIYFCRNNKYIAVKITAVANKIRYIRACVVASNMLNVLYLL